MSFIDTIKKKWKREKKYVKNEDNISETKIEYPPVNEDELIKRAESSILSEHPDTNNLKIWCSSEPAIFGEIRYLNVSWENGISECCIVDLLRPIVNEYPVCSLPFGGTSFYYIMPTRKFTDQVILEHARKYADCISKELPLNMHNVHCFKVGNVSVYDLSIGELKIMDVVR